MNTTFLLWGAVGLAAHMILKYWAEDGTFAENFFSKRTARYLVISVLFTVGALVPIMFLELSAATIEAAIAIGMAGGSMVANSQRITGDKSPSAKRAMVR